MSEGSASWQIEMERQPEKMLKRLPKNLLQRIRVAIWALADDPRPSGCKKLAGYENLYRVRVGSWRIVYAIEDDRLVILIVRIAPRSSAYLTLS